MKKKIIIVILVILLLFGGIILQSKKAKKYNTVDKSKFGSYLTSYPTTVTSTNVITNSNSVNILQGGFISQASSTVSAGLQVAGNLSASSSLTVAGPTIFNFNSGGVTMNTSLTMGSAADIIANGGIQVADSGRTLIDCGVVSNHCTFYPFNNGGNIIDLNVFGGILRSYFDSSGFLVIGNGVASSTLTATTLATATSTANASGLFNVDSSGNISASGTMNLFGTATFKSSLVVSSAAAGSFQGGFTTYNSGKELMDSGSSVFGTKYFAYDDTKPAMWIRGFDTSQTSDLLQFIDTTVAGKQLSVFSNLGVYTVGTGTVSSTYSSASLTMSSSTANPSGLFNVDASGDVSASGTWTGAGVIANAATDDFMCWDTAAATKGRFEHETANCTVSSARFKEHIQNLSSEKLLAEAEALRTVSFDYKEVGLDGKPRTIPEMGKSSTGMIAEEVAQIDPMLVGYTSEFTPQDLAFEQKNYLQTIVHRNGKTYIPNTVDYMRLSVINTGAIQAQQNEIKAITARLNSLEPKVSMFEKLIDWLKSFFRK